MLALALSLSCAGQVRSSKVHSSRKASASTARVPFVGCESDGQQGFLTAPKGQSKTLPLSAKAAQRLAFYQAANGFGVLAPKGWYCFGTYGSNGESLFVSQKPFNSSDLFAKDWSGFDGPAIQVSSEYGDTSGRFGVAKTIARVFPAYKEFVQDVIAERIAPAGSFPSGPYAADKLTYRGERTVEFQTAADSDGLGTQSRLKKGNAPIAGITMLVGDTPDLLQLSMRLTPDTNDLGPVIVQQFERQSKR
jgi:hypothetical protein